MTTPVWTSTQFQNWKSDCTKHIASQQPFEVQDVYRPENETYCLDLCAQHHYTCERHKHTLRCTPPAR